jgi:hypothetical protein
MSVHGACVHDHDHDHVHDHVGIFLEGPQQAGGPEGRRT